MTVCVRPCCYGWRVSLTVGPHVGKADADNGPARLIHRAVEREWAADSDELRAVSPAVRTVVQDEPEHRVENRISFGCPALNGTTAGIADESRGLTGCDLGAADRVDARRRADIAERQIAVADFHRAHGLGSEKKADRDICGTTGIVRFEKVHDKTQSSGRVRQHHRASRFDCTSCRYAETRFVDIAPQPD